MIHIQFGPHRVGAELHDLRDDEGRLTGKEALFAPHAGQIGKGAAIIVSDETTAADLRHLGYANVTVEKRRKQTAKKL